MPTRIDCELQVLRAIFGEPQGSLADLELRWLQANGATARSLVDAWREFLSDKGFVGPRLDAQRAWLASITPPTIPRTTLDLWKHFWCEMGGVIPP